MESGMKKFGGTLVALLATLVTVAVVVYFRETFWLGNTLDLGLSFQGLPIPPESYPILIFAVWSQLQRAKAHVRPRDGAYGKFWWWEDLLEAFGMVVYLAVTLFQAFITGNSPTFVIILFAFLVQAIFDAWFNGRHRYENDFVSADLTAANGRIAQLQTQLASATGRVTELEGTVAAHEATAATRAGQPADIPVPHRLVAERLPTVYRTGGGDA